MKSINHKRPKKTKYWETNSGDKLSKAKRPDSHANEPVLLRGEKGDWPSNIENGTLGADVLGNLWVRSNGEWVLYAKAQVELPPRATQDDTYYVLNPNSETGNPWHALTRNPDEFLFREGGDGTVRDFDTLFGNADAHLKDTVLSGVHDFIVHNETGVAQYKNALGTWVPIRQTNPEGYDTPLINHLGTELSGAGALDAHQGKVLDDKITDLPDTYALKDGTNLKANSIKTVHIADNAISNNKIAPFTITGNKLVNGTITSDKLSADSGVIYIVDKGNATGIYGDWVKYSDHTYEYSTPEVNSEVTNAVGDNFLWTQVGNVYYKDLLINGYNAVPFNTVTQEYVGSDWNIVYKNASGVPIVSSFWEGSVSTDSKIMRIFSPVQIPSTARTEVQTRKDHYKGRWA